MTKSLNQKINHFIDHNLLAVFASGSMYTNSKKTPKTNQKSTSFSISSILSSEKAGKDVTSLKRKHEEQSRVAIGRQGVAKLMQPDALSDQVTVTLENRELWGIFHEVGTEMVITKSGR